MMLKTLNSNFLDWEDTLRFGSSRLPGTNLRKSAKYSIAKKHIENPFYEFEDIHQQIFVAKSHENPTLPA